MTRRCAEIEGLIDRRASGLLAAEGLVLEQHLARCESCRQTAAFMRAIHEIVQQAPAELSERSRARAISGAFEDLARSDASNKRRKSPLWPIGITVAAAAAALLLFFRTHSPSPPEIAKAPGPSEQSRVEPSGPKPEVKEHAWIEAKSEETLPFAHARVALAGGSRVRFLAESSTLQLEEGGITVDVDPQPGKPFRVLTRHFRVEVLGARFTATADRVEVMEGRAQVFDLESKVLASELAPGSAFTYRGPTTSVEHPEPRVTARQWLARAREALSRGNPDAARELILRAEESEPHRQDRAEAGTLRAECALIEGDAEAAIRFYLSVADRFPDLSAGENGAFAAAQIATRSQNKQRTRSLYARYLARYPHGRFADEAHTRLDSR